jgi:putative SOS response-associated peptidase YedK
VRKWSRRCSCRASGRELTATDANELCAPIHDRMPVILDPADYAKWLGEQEASQEELLGLLRPAPAESIEAFPVGAAVGSVKNNDPSLVKRVAA